MTVSPFPNTQVIQLQAALHRGETLTTRRGSVLGQILFCEGCCCGRVDRGFPSLPRDRIKAHWQSQKLNKVIQLTISGCLGPCDLANVACLMKGDGTAIWLGGLSEQSTYDALLDWADRCQLAGRWLDLPEALLHHQFERFSGTGTRI